MTENLRLHAAWAPRTEPDGTVVVASPMSRRRLRIGAPGPHVHQALQRLRSGVALDGDGRPVEGTDGQRAAVDMLRPALEQLGAVVRRAPDDDVMAMDGSQLYDRQVRFFSYYETDRTSGLAMNERLQRATVMVCGLGGLGGWIALLCARLGIRTIVGIDPDDVELSNLHRQILYGTEHIGSPKASAARDALTRVDPQVSFVGHRLWIAEPEDVEPLLRGVDLVINPFPYIPSFARAARAVAVAAVRAGVPALNMPMTHGVGPLTVPGETACIECAWARLRDTYRVDGDNAVSAPSWAERGFLAALAPRQAVSGGLAVWEAVRFLSGMSRPRTLDGVAHLDISDYSGHDFLAVARDPNCTLCGDARPGTTGDPS